jgi:alkylation response protein AidB-like acyl-CoA dehydrogenase
LKEYERKGGKEMNFRFTEQEEAFREEVRGFLRQELPEGWKGRQIIEVLGTAEGQALMKSLGRKLGVRGWVGLQWPKEYGGLGASPMYGLIFEEEMGYHLAPVDVYLESWVGGTIIVHGTDEQKKRYLPGIASYETKICIGYSEPGAGSDLFALRTGAVEEKDCFIINGQKIFTSEAHKADLCWLAVRTDPSLTKYRGISIIMVDMHTHGITIRPLFDLLGIHHLNEVFFDDVRVPKDCLIGEINQGLLPIMTELDIERAAFGGGINTVARARKTLEELVEYLDVSGKCNSITRHKLAERAVDLEVARLMAYRVAWLATKGGVPHYEATVSKLFGSEAIQRFARTAIEIAGLKGMLMGPYPGTILDGRLTESYAFSLSETIGAGTSEVMRNLIASGLGLPRK